MAIPKVIHYCWFGGNPKPDLMLKCLDSWKTHCPDYEIIEWNESNYDVEANPYTARAFSDKKWAFLSDFVRLDVVYQYGGIYLDTDVEVVRALDDLLEQSFFLGYEDEDYINTGIGFGAVKGHPVVQLMMNKYHQLNDDYVTCPVLNTEALYEVYGEAIFLENQEHVRQLGDGRLYAPEYFCPKDFKTKQLRLTQRTYTIHHYDGSWLSPWVRFKKALKSHLYALRICVTVKK